MKQSIHRLKITLAAALLLTAISAAASPALLAQQQQTADNNSFAAERERAVRLINEGKYAEALPLFEKLSAAKEADGEIFFGLGIALLTKADKIESVAARKAERVKARNALLKAREMGLQSEDLSMLLSTVKPDGGERGKSDNAQANRAMDDAFRAFAAQDYAKAAELYEQAARLDPTLYEAALYTGNSFYGGKKYDKAGEWFAKAVALDQHRETAHRYWADALMLSGKTAEAQEKFFDAIIAEPYNQMAWRGLLQFAQRNDIQLAHLKIEIPTGVSSNEAGDKTTITLDPSTLKSDADGSGAWIVYGLTRALWRTEKFAKAFPGEKTYRRTLAEEADALRAVLAAVKNQSKTIKTLQPSLAKLQKINDAGLLEAYILLARPEAGIVRDYETYRQNNRDKLKRYLAEYVVKNGGN